MCYEVFTDDEALQSHMQMEHMNAFSKFVDTESFKTPPSIDMHLGLDMTEMPDQSSDPTNHPAAFTVVVNLEV